MKHVWGKQHAAAFRRASCETVHIALRCASAMRVRQRGSSPLLCSSPAHVHLLHVHGLSYLTVTAFKQHPTSTTPISLRRPW